MHLSELRTCRCNFENETKEGLTKLTRLGELDSRLVGYGCHYIWRPRDPGNWPAQHTRSSGFQKVAPLDQLAPEMLRIRTEHQSYIGRHDVPGSFVDFGVQLIDRPLCAAHV